MMIMMMMTKTAAAEVLLVVVEVSRITLHTATDSVTRRIWPPAFNITASRMRNSAVQSDTYHIKSALR